MTLYEHDIYLYGYDVCMYYAWYISDLYRKGAISSKAFKLICEGEHK